MALEEMQERFKDVRVDYINELIDTKYMLKEVGKMAILLLNEALL